MKWRINAWLATCRFVLERLRSLMVRERDSDGDINAPFANVRQPIKPRPGNRSLPIAVSEPDD